MKSDGGREKKPTILSPRKGRWMLNWYPPLFFQRIKVERIADDYRTARVLIRRSLLTRNLNGTTFGGTIFSGCDPVYPILYWQVFARMGERLQVWLKSTSVDYVKPAATTLVLEFELTDDDLRHAREGLERSGKVICLHSNEALDAEGDVCARIETAIYLRRTRRLKEVSGY